MIELKPLCTAIVDVDPPIAVGKTPAGIRSIGELKAVTVTGERMKASLHGTAAADWILLNGRVGDIDVRMTLKTDDGAFVFVHYTGKLDLAREGGPVAIVCPRFETGDERYAWLNDVQAIGRATFGPGENGQTRLTYEFYEAR